MLEIYGDIDPYYGVSAQSVADKIAEADKVDHIVVRINSGGGSAFDGVTIYNILKSHLAKVTVFVDGIAASAASVIAMAGDEVFMGAASEIMIHHAHAFFYGDHVDCLKLAAELQAFSLALAEEIYQPRCGVEFDQIIAWMDESRWFTASEAVEHGFADGRAPEIEAGDASYVPKVSAQHAFQQYISDRRQITCAAAEATDMRPQDIQAARLKLLRMKTAKLKRSQENFQKKSVL